MPSRNHLKISFVIPAYNEEALIGACLTSIQTALASGSYDAEIIVVNNASTDQTASVAALFPGVKIVNEPRKGLTRARQTGFEASSGDIIANIDADNLIDDTWVHKVIDIFSREQKVVGLSGPLVYYDLPLHARILVNAIFYRIGYIFLHIPNQYIFHTGAMMQGGNFVVRRSALEQINGFDTSIEFYGEDTDVACRLSKVGRVWWRFNLTARSSGRRLAKEGIIMTGLRYGINNIVTMYRGRPLTRTHADIRKR